MTRLLKPAAVALLALWLSACGVMQTRQTQPTPNVTHPNSATNALYSQYNEWKNVRYRAGGMSKQGVDCSGFVYLTFNSRFHIRLPRSTNEQVRVGREVSQNALAAGDLVFFRTGRVQRHVGIYLENRKFLHASTIKGVMISSLDDSYWSRAYWKSMRIHNF